MTKPPLAVVVMVDVMLLTVLALLVTSCSSPAPPARDVQACKLVKHDLAVTDEDSLHYYMTAAIAVTPELKQGIQAIGRALALIGTPYSSTGYDQENTAINAVAAICKNDGITGIGG